MIHIRVLEITSLELFYVDLWGGGYKMIYNVLNTSLSL